jgi:hypothetical protein
LGRSLREDIVGSGVITDRGYDSNEYRRALEGNNSEPVIPGRRNRKEEIEYDKEKYKKRDLIERIFGLGSLEATPSDLGFSKK